MIKTDKGPAHNRAIKYEYKHKRPYFAYLDLYGTVKI